MSQAEVATSPDYEIYWDKLKESAEYHPANRFRYHLILSGFTPWIKSGMTVVDLGCGDSSLLRKLRSNFEGAHYFGCDVSQKVVESNIRRNPGMKFFQADVASPEFGESARGVGLSSADFVFCSEVIEHVEKDAQLLANASALLKSGGHLVLTTQSGPRYRMDREILHHLRHYERKDLEAKVRAAGLDVRVGTNCGFPVLNLQKILVNLMFERVVAVTTSHNKPKLWARTIMAAMYYAMRFAPRFLGGPQILIVARKK